MGKKLMSLILAFTLVLSLSVPAFAAETTVMDAENVTKEDILNLRPFVELREDGTLFLDAETAEANGAKEGAITALQMHFLYLNAEVSSGDIVIDEDLNIIGGERPVGPYNNNARAASCCGHGINAYTEYWWGYQRKACNCESNRIVNDLNTLAAGGAMGVGGFGVAGGITAIFGATIAGGILAIIGGGLAFDSGYWWLVATRIQANNEGNGVICDMTYALVFDITPQ